MLTRGDDLAWHDEIAARRREGADYCDAVLMAFWALSGWLDARTLAPAGGAPWLVAPVAAAIEELERVAGGPAALEAEYAQVAVRAAAAAAQDERAELSLLLTHARDLAERIGARGRRAVWPRPYNLLAGELWLEVDRYDEAREAFERAVRTAPSPLALAGLGRALSRLNRHEEACRAFRQVAAASAALMEDLRGRLANCP